MGARLIATVLILTVLLSPSSLIGQSFAIKNTGDQAALPKDRSWTSYEYPHNKANSTDPLSEIQATLDLLQQGEKVIELNENYKDIILVVGNTGAGKSTLTQWLAGDSAALRAAETRPGSGEFVVLDTHNRIGQSTITSQTIFPELVVDNATKTAFYDFPGFSNTKSTSNEIATSYFLKKVINHADRIKILFVVNYSSLRKTVDRQDFIKFIKHATELVRNIENLKNSIAIVATKVDNQYSRSKLIDDDTVTENIADFLQEVRQELLIKHSDGRKQLNANYIRLIDLFLIKDGNSYTHIGLFRRPDDTGFLDEFGLLCKEKEFISNILFKNLVFTNKTHSDIGHTISENAQNDITILVGESNERILFSVRVVAEEIKEFYQKIIKIVEYDINTINTTSERLESYESILIDIQKQVYFLTSGLNHLRHLVIGINNLSSPKELSSKINDFLKTMNITVSQENVLNILYQGDLYELFNEVLSRELNSSTTVPAWAYHFDRIVYELTGISIQIRKTYNDMNKRFEHKIESDIKKSCQEIWKYFFTKEVQNHDCRKLRDDFGAYFSKLSQMQLNIEIISPHNYIEQIKISTPFVDFKISNFIHLKIVKNDNYYNVLKKEMYNLLKYLKNSQDWYNFLYLLYERLSEYDIQKDLDYYFAKASEIILHSENIHLQPTDLKPFLKTCCHREYEIKLGFNEVKNITLDIPKIDALKKIIHLTLKHEMDFKIEETRKAVIIKRQFIRTSDLLWMTHKTEIKHIEIFALEKIFIDKDLDYINKDMTVSIISPTWDIQGDQKIILAGLPGKPHTITKANNTKSPGSVEYVAIQGLPGDPGGRFLGIGRTFINGHRLVISTDGGRSGHDKGDNTTGTHGDTPPVLQNNECFSMFGVFDSDFIKREYNKIGYEFKECNYLAFSELRRFCTVRGKSCYNGGNGVDEAQMLDQFRILKHYKNYVRQNVLKIMKESALQEFLDEIENNNNIFNLYVVGDYLDGFINLENHFSILHKRVSFLPYYQTFLNRIDSFVSNVDNHYVKKYNKILKYLRMTTNVRIYSIKYNVDNYMVIDIIKYLTSVKEHIDTHEKTLKEVEIDSFKNNYKDSITSEISTANDQIRNVVLLEIDKIYEKVDIQIQYLIDDIVKERLKAVDQQNDLIEKKYALANQMIARSFLESFKLIGICLSLTGPWGVLAGGMIGIGAKIAEDNLEDIKNSRVETYKELPQVIDYYKREKEYLKNNLNSVAHDIKNTNNSDLQTILNEIKPLQILLNSSNVKENDYFKEKLKIKSKLSKYHKELVSKQDILEKDITRNLRKRSYSRLQALDPISFLIEANAIAVSRAQNAITIAEAGYDYLSSFGNDNDKVAAVEESIHLVSEKITQLKEYEQTIYNVFIPMRNDFENSLNVVGQLSSNKPHAALDIGKWKIQNIVKDFQTHIQYMVQVSDPIIKLQLDACIEKLQGGMQTMLQIYDRIQTYNDHAKFAEYLATLRSEASVTGIEEFSSDIHKIDLTRQSILILQEYEKASSAFIQHVYPFAGLYLDHLEFSPHLQTNNLSDLVYNAAQKINFIRTELTMATTVIKNKGYTLFPEIRFDNENIDKKPFFVWKHGTYKYEISYLLQGQEVTLEADIHEGVKQNAIKFNEIGIRFISANTILQSELDVSLKNFLVRMTHGGKSYFRCDDKYHVIHHSAVSVTHSASSDPEGHYRHMDEGAAHLARSAAMCSPYTTWRVQLETQSGESFDVLSQYSREVIDVALEGWGQYVKLGLNVCNDSLDKYYEEATFSYISNELFPAASHE